MAGDGGDPAAEPVVGPREAGQVAGDLEPGFRGDVLGVLAGQGVQVAQQPGLDVAVQQPERLRVPLLRPPHRASQIGACPSLRFGPGLRPVLCIHASPGLCASPGPVDHPGRHSRTSGPSHPHDTGTDRGPSVD